MNVLSITISLALLLPSLGYGQPGRNRGSVPIVPEVGAVKADASESGLGKELQESFVWLGSAPVGQQVYAVFRKQFALPDAPEAATLELFADSRYILWINGAYVERGPCRFDPIAPEYDTLDVRSHLRLGTNVIAVLVHHAHDGQSGTDWVSINGRIMRHAPGLTARLELHHPGGQTTALATDASWRGTTRTRFLPSPTDRWENTWSSIPDRIDARRDAGDWTQPEFDDSAWEKPVSVDGKSWGALRPRGIPRLRESEVGPITLLEHTREGPVDLAARWIWSPEPHYPAQRPPRWSAPEGERFFRRGLELPEGTSNVVVWATADNEFDCYVNGRKVGDNHGDISSWMTMQRMEATSQIKPGRNVIAIRATNKHYGSASDPAGLLVVMTWQAGSEQGRLISDSSWKSDARATAGWEAPDFDDSDWAAALTLCPYPQGPWGNNLRNGPSAQPIGDTPRPLAAALPLLLETGNQLVIDAGEFAQAYSVLDIEADEGTELELEYAQRYFETGRRPSESYGHINRYVARAGRQTYMSGDTFGFKYLVVRLKSGNARLHGLRLVNRLYPFDVAGRFHSGEPMLDQLWTNCVNTIRLCSEDAYVDCATRERVEWMADGYAVAYRATRVALAGPGEDGSMRYADPRLLRNLLRHIGQSLQPDGRLKAHHPSDRWDIHGYIEDYSCLWMHALREYHDHTGDLDLIHELWPALTAQLQWFLDRRTTNGLVKAREFVYPGSNPLCYQVCEGTTLNAYVIRALRDAAVLAGRTGHRRVERDHTTAARELEEAMNRLLWDEAAGTYSGALQEGTRVAPTVPAAFIPLVFEAVPADRRERVQRWLLAHHREQGGLPFAFQFLFQALYDMDRAEADQAVLDEIRRLWAGMARSETQTVWEGFGPGENCHEAGAVPAYFLSAYVLGVRLDGPASAGRLLIQPRLGDLRAAEGTVVTELGPVPVRWKRDATGKSFAFDLQIPEGVTAALALPLAGEKPRVQIDGHDPAPAALKMQGRYWVLDLGPGVHHGHGSHP